VQPSAVGSKVWADATLEKVEGRRLTFAVNAHDTRGLIAAGRVTRVIVDRDRFMEKAG
jgi:predicted thioesterase